MVWSADSVDQSANSAKKPLWLAALVGHRGQWPVLGCWRAGTWTWVTDFFQRGIYYRERLRAYVDCQASSHMFFAFVVY